MVAAKRKKKVTAREVLNGRFFESEWFRRNRILMFMIFIMLLTNITVRYKSEKVIREMTAYTSPNRVNIAFLISILLFVYIYFARRLFRGLQVNTTFFNPFNYYGLTT